MGRKKRIRGWIVERLGGRARARVIFIFAMVLAADSADMGAVGAMAVPLQEALHIGKEELGLILTLSSASNALMTLLFGFWVDRMNRTRMLAIVLWLWGVGVVLCGSATSYELLLIARVGLGAVIAATVPVVASLIGDYIEPSARGEVYGYILAGEFIGTAFGLLVAGELGALSWRLGFWVLAIPAPLLAWAVHRLPEPERGGASFIASSAPPGRGEARVSMSDEIREAGIEPRASLIYDDDPADRSLLWAIVYVLRIPTNVVLIVSSAFGYLFFAGIRAFGVEFLGDSFDLDHSGAIGVMALIGTGATVGVFTGGKLGDALLARGHLRARVSVATVAYLISATAFLAGLLVPTAWLRGGLFFAAACALGAVNPPLDAARLDIMHPGLWGRAEATRMALRKVAEAGAPVLFGYLAGQAFGGGYEGMREAFLVMCIPLFLSGGIAALALRSYLRDTATATAFAARTQAG